MSVDLATLAIRVETLEAKAAERDLDRLAAASGRAEKSAGGLKSAMASLAGALAGLGIARLAREAIAMADAWSSMQGRINLVSTSTANASKAMSDLFAIAQRTHVDLEATVDLYTRMARATQDLGVSQRELKGITETINQALSVSGTSAAEAAGGLMQLSQGFAAGALRGDELNSVIESMPRVAQALADGMGVSIGQLRKLGAEGKITADAMRKAFVDQADEIAAEFSKMPTTVEQAMTSLRNSILQAIGTFDQAAGISAKLAAAITGVADNLGAILRVAGVVASVVGVALFGAMSRYLAVSLATTASNLALAAGLSGMSARALIAAGAMRGLSAAMSFFGGPIGLAITGVALAIGAVASASSEAERQSEKLTTATQQFGAAMRQANEFLDGAAQGSGDFGTKSQGTVAGTKNLTGATSDLALATWGLANARAEAARQALAEAYASNQKQLNESRNPGFLKGVGRALIEGDARFNRGARERRLAYEKSLEDQSAALLGAMMKITFDPAANKADNYAKALGGVTDKTKAAHDATGDYIKRLREEAEEVGKTDKQLRALEVARALASPGVTAAQRAQILFWAQQREKAYEAKAAFDAFGAAFDKWLDARNQTLIDTKAGKDEIEILEAELRLITATNEERAVEIARLRAIQELKRRGDYDPTSSATQDFVTTAENVARANERLHQGQEAYNEGLTTTLDLLREVHGRAQDLAGTLADAFGAAGSALGAMLANVTGLRAQLEQIAVQREQDLQKAGTNAIKIGQANARAARDEASARVDAYGDMLAAAKGFFKEGSTGWRLMQAAEVGYRAFQFAASVRAMAQNAAETTTSVASAGLRATADGAAGIAKIFSQLGMFAFPVAAAALAFMASAGVNARGGGAGASFDLKAKQDAQGTGSVLGDASAQSASITRSLEASREVQEKMLGYDNTMVKHLASIDAKIGAFATVLARQIGAGKLFSTDALNLGEFDKGPSGLMKFLMPVAAILPGLFSSKTTRTLQDRGLQFPDQTVGGIVGGEFAGSTYQQVLENTKKKFLGITYSDKNRTSTVTGELPEDFTQQVGLIVASLREGVLAAAGVLGLDGAEATIDAFKVSLGQISLKDMTGEEIQEALNAVFGKLADDMAAAVGGGLVEQYQQLGEGAFETMVRLANGLELVKAQFQATGVAFDRVGTAAVTASQAMIEAAGGMESFASSMDFFRNHFLTEAERMGPVMERVAGALAALGLAGVDTIEKFKAAVLGAMAAQNADLLGGLLSIQEDFFDVTEYQKKLAEAQATAASAANSAANATSEATTKWRDLADRLASYSRGLNTSGTAALSPLAAYRSAKNAFDALKPGDVDSFEKLMGGVGNAYIDAARAVAPDQRTLALAIGRVREFARKGEEFARTQAGDVYRPIVDATTAVRGEVAALRADNKELQAQVATLLQRVATAVETTKTVLVRVTRDGESMVTEAAA